MSKEEGVSSDGVESGSYEHKAESPPSENVFPPNSLELSVPQTKAESITRADPPSPLDPLQVKEETPRAHDSLSQGTLILIYTNTYTYINRNGGEIGGR